MVCSPCSPHPHLYKPCALSLSGNSQFFTCEKTECIPEKLKKSQYPLRESKKPHVKISLIVPAKNMDCREKSQKSVRDSDFLFVKKCKESPEKAFTYTLDFHEGKKILSSYIVISAYKQKCDRFSNLAKLRCEWFIVSDGTVF